MRFIWICVLLFSSCSLDYAISNNKDTATQSKQKKTNDCQSDLECESGFRCLSPKLDNCQNDINCTILRTRGDLSPKCRKLCDLSVTPSQCPSSQRCILDTSLQNGICMNGICNSDEDCGRNNSLPNKCLDHENGPKSGICALNCNPLRCHQNICSDCPSPQAGCELINNTMDFICVPSGTAVAFATCDNENIFCQPGHFCHEQQCRPYCNTRQTPTTCPANTFCRAFFSQSEIGFCEKN